MRTSRSLTGWRHIGQRALAPAARSHVSRHWPQKQCLHAVAAWGARMGSDRQMAHASAHRCSLAMAGSTMGAAAAGVSCCHPASVSCSHAPLLSTASSTLAPAARRRSAMPVPCACTVLPSDLAAVYTRCSASDSCTCWAGWRTTPMPS